MKLSISSIYANYFGSAISSKSQVAYILTNGGYRLVVLLGGYSIALTFDASQYNYYSELFWAAGLLSVVTSWSASNGFIHELNNGSLGFDTYVGSVIVTAIVSAPLAIITFFFARGEAAYIWVFLYSIQLGALQNFVYFNLYSGEERAATLLVLALVLIALIGYSLTCFLKVDSALFFQIQTISFFPLTVFVGAKVSKSIPTVRLKHVRSLLQSGGTYVPAAAIVSTLFVLFQYNINHKLPVDEVRLINLGLPLIGLLGFAISNVISVNVTKLLAAHQKVSMEISRVAVILIGLTLASYASSSVAGLLVFGIFGILIVAGISNGMSFLLPIVAAASGNHKMILYASAASFLVASSGIYASKTVESLLFFFALFFTLRLVIMSRLNR